MIAWLLEHLSACLIVAAALGIAGSIGLMCRAERSLIRGLLPRRVCPWCEHEYWGYDDCPDCSRVTAGRVR